MTNFVISVANSFSPSPAGRHKGDGPFPGEVFRDSLLIPALRSNESVTVDFDGTEACGSSFLDEAFGGLVRQGGFTEQALRKTLHFQASRKSYEAKVWKYIHEAVAS